MDEGWSVEISRLKMILGEKVRRKGFREFGQVCSGYVDPPLHPQTEFWFLRG